MEDKSRKESQLYSSFSSIRNSHATASASNDVDELKKIVFAMWDMIKEKGTTDEEFNRACARVDNMMKSTHKDPSSPVTCPSCGKLMQRVDAFKCACPYCRHSEYLHMFTQYYNPDENLLVEQEPDVTSFAAPVDETPEEKPYDLDADLRFDDL